MLLRLVYVANEKGDDWDVHLPGVEFACNNSFGGVSGLNELGDSHDA